MLFRVNPYHSSAHTLKKGVRNRIGLLKRRHLDRPAALKRGIDQSLSTTPPLLSGGLVGRKPFFIVFYRAHDRHDVHTGHRQSDLGRIH